MTATRIPRDLSTAPRDGTMVQLLVGYNLREDPDSWMPLEDSDVAWTTGANGFDDHEVDEWYFVGWNWTQDCFVHGVAPADGLILGWLPLGESA